jgi:hypothetical protein
LQLVALMMAAVSISETSVNFYEPTWRNVPDGCRIHTGRSKELKCHLKAF